MLKREQRANEVTAWIAICAVLLATLAPGVAQALAASRQQSTSWADICTSARVQVQPDFVPTGGSGGGKEMLPGHCPFCLNHAGHFVLPTAPLDLSPAIAGSDAFFRSPVARSSPCFACTSPHSRAPPALS